MTSATATLRCARCSRRRACAASWGSALDDSAYVTPRGEDKTVRWWVMTLVADDGFEPNHEVDAVRWVAVSDADDLASYQTDRDVVHSFVTSGASNGS